MLSWPEEYAIKLLVLGEWVLISDYPIMHNVQSTRTHHFTCWVFMLFAQNDNISMIVKAISTPVSVLGSHYEQNMMYIYFNLPNQE